MIFYLGPEGTHSQEAACRWGGGGAALCPCRSLPETFDQLARQDGAAAVVPIENSVEGPVTQTLDLLAATRGLTVTAAFGLPVRHCLAVAPGVAPGDIRTVYSHPQALAQCGIWLDTHLSGALRVPLASTSEAARRAAGEAAAAAVASRLAASLYGLKIVTADIQDSPNNETRFIAVVRGAAPCPAAAVAGPLHSLLHLVAPDRPGALLHLLAPFHDAAMNLSFIQSRPLQGRAWQYGFFIEAEGNVLDSAFTGVLLRLRQTAESMRVLGVYPSGRSEPGAAGGEDSADVRRERSGVTKTEEKR